MEPSVGSCLTAASMELSNLSMRSGKQKPCLMNGMVFDAINTCEWRRSIVELL